jgi:hypothetical protein
MSLVMHYSITFPPEQRPPFPALVQKIGTLSGLAVHYEAEKLRLACPALNLSLYLYEEGEEQYTITRGTPKADYLLVTTIWALQQLGGTFQGQLPCWAGQSWQQLNKWAYRLKRHYVYHSRDAPW